MIIGMNAAAAVKRPRTGVEEYAYQLIKHLTMLPEAAEHRFLLYVPGATPIHGLHTDDADGENPSRPPFVKGRSSPLWKRGVRGDFFDFPLPDNFEIKELKWSFPMWTQIRLAVEMLKNKPDALFIPAHILPQAHPKNSVVTIHGLEYEYFPVHYPFWFRQYLRWSTKYAVRHAAKTIAVSESTKNDLVKFYGAKESKITVVHHGVEIQNSKFKNQNDNEKFKIKNPYLLYVGRIELKKNILGILDAYKILKEKYQIPHGLILAGAPGYGYDKIKSALTENCSPLQRRTVLRSVHELGYVSEAEKWELLRNANVFLFPTFYEGFGIPILEAQAAGAPVVASNNSSVPEVAGEAAFLVNPKNPEQIAQALYKIIDDKALCDKLMQSGYENVKRFSWEKCARETLKVLCE